MATEAKRLGDEAVQLKKFETAEACYSEALTHLSATSPERAAVLCNRALARLRREAWKLAVEDATAALDLQPEEKLRVKALFRRGTAREALGELQGADSDLNLALKAAPSNEGIVQAAQRVRAALRQEAPANEVLKGRWVPCTTHLTATVLQRADEVPGRVRGYMNACEHPCVRFRDGSGVQVHARTGSILAILGTLGAPQVAPKDVNVSTWDRDFHDAANFDWLNGLGAEYDIGGNLTVISNLTRGDLHGPRVVFNKDGSVSFRETACYHHGRIVSKLKSDIPEGYVKSVLQSLVVPIKKALGIGLSAGEEHLCEEHAIDIDRVIPAALAEESPLRQPEPRLEPYREPQGEVAPPLPAVGATWEELFRSRPSCEVGPAWCGPCGTDPKEAVPKPAVRALDPQSSCRRPDGDVLPEALERLSGNWIDEANDTPVGKIAGGCVIWHRSFQTSPTKLQVGPGTVLMKLESRTHEASVEVGPRMRLRWSDGDVWIRA